MRLFHLPARVFLVGVQSPCQKEVGAVFVAFFRGIDGVADQFGQFAVLAMSLTVAVRELHGIERLSDLRIRDDTEKVAMVMTPVIELRRLLGRDLRASVLVLFPSCSLQLVVKVDRGLFHAPRR